MRNCSMLCLRHSGCVSPTMYEVCEELVWYTNAFGNGNWQHEAKSLSAVSWPHLASG
jgi:hypothetical protein